MRLPSFSSATTAAKLHQEDTRKKRAKMVDRSTQTQTLCAGSMPQAASPSKTSGPGPLMLANADVAPQSSPTPQVPLATAPEETSKSGSVASTCRAYLLKKKDALKEFFCTESPAHLEQSDHYKGRELFRNN